MPSAYAKAAKAAGLEILTWTIERSGPVSDCGPLGSECWYHQTVREALEGDGDVYEVLHVLASDVGVRGVFSDWPATTTFYANCLLDRRVASVSGSG